MPQQLETQQLPAVEDYLEHILEQPTEANVETARKLLAHMNRVAERLCEVAYYLRQETCYSRRANIAHEQNEGPREAELVGQAEEMARAAADEVDSARHELQRAKDAVREAFDDL